jgi:ubiquitin carboxyl-terminal hydrolase L5
LNDERVLRDDSAGEAFHFVAYLPFEGTVYELDGLQSGPIEVGTCVPRGIAGAGEDDASSMEEEKGGASGGRGGNGSGDDEGEDGWLAVARSAIQDRMDRESTEHVKYNLMAVVQDKRIPLLRVLEADPANEVAAARLSLEEGKRERWKVENQRRRHNYVPLVVEMLRSLARQSDGEVLRRLAAQGQERANARKEAASAKSAQNKK